MADPPDCSHLLIIQDDVEISRGFVPALKQIAEAQPNIPVCLFLARFPRDTRPRPEAAMKMGRRYVQLPRRNFLPIVAVLWPIAKLREFAEWAEENPHLMGNSDPRSDDAMGGRWKLRTNQTVYATVPSLVEHPDREPSTIGKQAMWGKDRSRCAVFLAEDATDFDWSQP